jgi:hypothetical protein
MAYVSKYLYAYSKISVQFSLFLPLNLYELTKSSVAQGPCLYKYSYSYSDPPDQKISATKRVGHCQHKMKSRDNSGHLPPKNISSSFQ